MDSASLIGVGGRWMAKLIYPAFASLDGYVGGASCKTTASALVAAVPPGTGLAA